MGVFKPGPWFLAMTEQITYEPMTIAGGAIRLPASAGNAALIDWKHLEKLSNKEK